MRVALVLGGGGLSGLAFHAGVLCAMERDLGWDPRAADLIVGTSAGSIVGAMLRSGIPAAELAALASGAGPDRNATAVVQARADGFSNRPAPPRVRKRDSLRPLRIPHHSLLTTALRRPRAANPLAALMTLVPDGRIDVAVEIDGLFAGLSDEWPAEPLWLCSTRRSDSQRIVFGQSQAVPLRDAVAASCAVPGYFAPVVVDGQHHVDGGLRSPTNSDLASQHRGELDLVVISSPMSGNGLGFVGLEAWVRRFSARTLRREVDGLRAAEIPTVVLEPGPETREAMGTGLFDDGCMRGVVGASFLDAGEQLRARRTRALVAGLSTRRHRG